jgi:hypothetical protein
MDSARAGEALTAKLLKREEIHMSDSEVAGKNTCQGTKASAARFPKLRTKYVYSEWATIIVESVSNILHPVIHGNAKNRPHIPQRPDLLAGSEDSIHDWGFTAQKVPSTSG